MQDKGDSPPTEIFQIAQGRKDSASQTNNLQTWKESLAGKQAYENIRAHEHQSRRKWEYAKARDNFPSFEGCQTIKFLAGSIDKTISNWFHVHGPEMH